MSRALLALLLLSPAWAAEDKPKKEKPSRKALEEAACGPGAPPMLVRAPKTDDAPDAPGLVAGASLFDSGDGCAERLGGLSGDAEFALRPSGELTPDAVTAAFTGSKKVDELSTRLTQAQGRLTTTGGDSLLSQLGALFDNSAARSGDPKKDLRSELTSLLAPREQRPAKVVVETAAEKKATPVVAPVPGPNDPPAWYDPALGPGGVSPLLGSGETPHVDGRGYWPFPSRTGPPQGFDLTPNVNGTPTSRPDQPIGNSAGTPIWGPFYAKFKKCALEVTGSSKCEPYNYGIYRPSSMCHGVSRAIDVHAMRCLPESGEGQAVIHTALQNGKFAQLSECMKRDGMKTIWHQCFINCNPFNVTNHHYDHAHFSIGCPAPFRW